jgi:hypothetical protein
MPVSEEAGHQMMAIYFEALKGGAMMGLWQLTLPEDRVGFWVPLGTTVYQFSMLAPNAIFLGGRNSL